MSDALAATMALSSAPFATGVVFADRYEVITRLGEGGMGAVYRVRDRELDEEVALKVLRAELSGRADALTRFRREVKLARRVTHPNVARTFDLGSADGVSYLTMELIHGSSLAGRIASARPSLGESLRLAAEMAAGLAAAHAAGVVHRDLKPENVMLSGERVVLTDFGIASLAEGLDDGALKTGMIVGTPAYMAPEQLDGSPLDGRTDVYALGVVLFELLTGRLPFESASGSAAFAKLTRPPPNPRELDPNLSEGLSSLVLAALAQRREGRLDAAQFRARVEGLRGGGGALVAAPRARVETTRTPVGAARPGRRRVSVAAFDAPGEAASLGVDLASAVRDALVKVRGIEVTREHGELRLEASVRVASTGRVRVRLRLVDAATEAALSSEVIDGNAEDAFGLEDQVAARATAAVEERVSSRLVHEPKDPAAREVYARARAAYEAFSPESTSIAVSLLEPLAGDDKEGFVQALLACTLLNRWAHTGAGDSELLSRAEDLALRAAEHEPQPPLAFLAIARMRCEAGEFKATVRALEDTLERAPLVADAHAMLGGILCECARMDEGLRHLERAIQLSPGSVLPLVAKANCLSCYGDRPEVRATIARAKALAGPTAAVFPELRAAFMWNDPALAGDLADRLEALDADVSYKSAVPFLRLVASRTPIPVEAVRAVMEYLTGPTVSVLRRTIMLRNAVDMYAGSGHDEDALLSLERLAPLPCIDLAWLDHAPSLARFRGDPRFALVRAVTAERVADLFG